jgi:hypothetical protein
LNSSAAFAIRAVQWQGTAARRVSFAKFSTFHNCRFWAMILL